MKRKAIGPPSPWVWIAGVLAALQVTGCGAFVLVNEDAVFVAFGDSTTAGPSTKDYVEFLPELTGLPARQFANEGSGGETTSEGLERLDRMISLDVYPNARQLIYWQGGADVIDFVRRRDPLLLLSPSDPDYPFSDLLESELNQTQQNIERAVSLANDAGWGVVVATYFPIPSISLDCDALLFGVILPAQAQNADAYLAMLNDRIRIAALRAGASLVDVQSLGGELLADSNNYFDCNHLSASGNEIVARSIAESLLLTAPGL